MNPRRALVVIGVLTVALGASAAWHWTPTFDEPNHLEMGRRILQQGDWSRFDNSKMPVSVFNALPWLLSEGADPRLRWWLARLPQLGWLLGTMLLVHRWARRRRPTAPAVALGAAALVAWDPNLVAHSSLVTTDAPATFFVLAAAWTWVRALERPDRRRSAIAGAVFGLAQAAKFTSVFLVPIHALVALAWCAFARTLRPLRALPVFLLTAWLALNGAYAFQGTFTPTSEISWQSRTLEPLSGIDLPLPVPRPWAEGLDWVKSDDDRGHGNVYLDGEMTPGGQDDYFLRALAWKVPLPLLLLGLGGLLAGTAELVRDRRGRKDSLGLLVPPLFLLAWFSIPFNFQLGVRYCLPVLPFLALAAARLPAKWLLGGAAWVLISHLSWWPWTLSYFNERLVDRTQAWQHLADSNLDWGQTGRAVEAWREENPRGLVDPAVPAPGPLLVSANALTGVLGDPARMACLRTHHPPTRHLAYAAYPYALTLDDLGACFPTVRPPLDPSGSLPSGDHLLVLHFRGEAQLSVAGETWTGQGSSERLLGVAVRATGAWSAQWSHQGPDFAVYLDGQRLVDQEVAP